MIKIQKHGSFLYPNSEGFIEPVFPEMQKEWKIIVDKTVEYYRTDFGDKIHSIYVRGSVAKGQAVKRVSDVDTYCVMKDDDFKPNPENAKAFNSKIVNEYPYCFQVELVAMSKNFIMDNHKRRMTLKTQGRCVYGEDLALEIEGQKLCDMYHVLPNFRLHSKVNLPNYLEMDKGNSPRLKSCCSWMMKNLLRSAYELIMLDEGKWTSDLFLCHQLVSERFPEMKEYTYRALDLALNPIDDGNEMTFLADKFYDFFESNLSLVKIKTTPLP